MSIYSGFATRHQQENYDQCLDSVIYILQKRLLKFYNNEKADEDKFISLLNKLYGQMRAMEPHKYLQPKSSHTFDELMVFLKQKQREESSMNVCHDNSTKFEVESSLAGNDEHFDKQKKHKKKINQVEHKIVKTDNEHQLKNEQLFQKNQNIQKQGIKNNTIKQRNPSHHLMKGGKRHILHQNSHNSQDKETNTYKSTALMNNIKGRHRTPHPKDLSSQKVDRRENVYTAVQIEKDENRKRGFSTLGRNKKETKIDAAESSIDKNQKSFELGKKPIEDDQDVRQLIRGYISKTKKSYIRGYNKRKEEIDILFKNI